MRRAWWLGGLACVSCAGEAQLHPSAPAVLVKSACTAASRPTSAAGLDVRPGRRHSQAQTIFVTNVGAEPREVAIQQVSRVEGPCSADWARQTPLSFFDAATGAPPGTATIPPGQSIQIRIGDQRVAATWPCTKLGLAVWMKVGDDVVCADAGAWIAESDAGDELGR